MKKILLLLINLFLIINFNAEDKIQKITYAKAVKNAAQAVVSIKTTAEISTENHPMFNDPLFRFFFSNPNIENQPQEQENLRQGLGSGVIIDKKGHILTNYHVVKDANTINVRLQNGKNKEGKIIGYDDKIDLAILKIEDEETSSINIGDSDNLDVGDIVLAIGNPFGIGNTVTQGIVSGLGSVSARTTEKSEGLSDWLDNLIQTDAAINPGNSGGALIDIEGNLIGINIAIVSQTGANHGIGFAIPVNTAKKVMNDLIEKGHISRGWLGVELSDLTQEIIDFLGYDENFGVYVQSVVKYSPAWEGGINHGDIISKINDIPIKTTSEALKMIAELEIDKKYEIEIFRSFQLIKCYVTILELLKDF